MLRRAYSQVYQARYPAYIGLLYVMNGIISCHLRNGLMRTMWMDTTLIKTSCSGQGVLSEQLYFVPRWLNNFITDSKGSRGTYPIGVYFDTSSG